MPWKGIQPPGKAPEAFEPEQSADECPKCDGLGVIVADDGSTVKCSCGAWDMANVARALSRARLPERYRRKTLEGFKAARGDKARGRLRDAARSYAIAFEREEKGLILRGVTGCGKTHLAVGILHDVLKRGFTGQYCNVTDLLTRLRESYSDESAEREGLILEEAGSVDLLVFDDLGAEMPTDWVRDRIYLILNRRYESARPVIVTTNCDDAELREKIGARIVSRLYEMCDRFEPFPKEDYRFAHLRDG